MLRIGWVWLAVLTAFPVIRAQADQIAPPYPNKAALMAAIDSGEIEKWLSEYRYSNPLWKSVIGVLVSNYGLTPMGPNDQKICEYGENPDVLRYLWAFSLSKDQADLTRAQNIYNRQKDACLKDGPYGVQFNKAVAAFLADFQAAAKTHADKILQAQAKQAQADAAAAMAAKQKREEVARQAAAINAEAQAARDAESAQRKAQAELRQAQAAADIAAKEQAYRDRVDGIRSGKIPITSIEDAQIYYDAKGDGNTVVGLMASPPVNGDGKYYRVVGVLDSVDGNSMVLSNGTIYVTVIKDSSTQTSGGELRYKGPVVFVGQDIGSAPYKTVAGEERHMAVFKAKFIYIP